MDLSFTEIWTNMYRETFSRLPVESFVVVDEEIRRAKESAGKVAGESSRESARGFRFPEEHVCTWKLSTTRPLKREEETAPSSGIC